MPEGLPAAFLAPYSMPEGSREPRHDEKRGSFRGSLRTRTPLRLAPVSESSHDAVSFPAIASRAMSSPLVAVVMGSKSDWETMAHAVTMLEELGVPHEVKVVSAHRTPDLLFTFAEGARARGIRVIVAGAGGAAHLPGMIAAKTTLPVLGVPVQSKALSGLDSLLSIVQMPGGIPVGTLAIGHAGAKNAGLLAAQILATTDEALAKKLDAYREAQRDAVLSDPDPRGTP